MEIEGYYAGRLPSGPVWKKLVDKYDSSRIRWHVCVDNVWIEVTDISGRNLLEKAVKDKTIRKISETRAKLLTSY